VHNPSANRGQQEATSEPQTEFHCAISVCESFINLRKQRKVFQLLTQSLTHSLTHSLTLSLTHSVDQNTSPLTVVHLVKKFPVFDDTRNFIIAFRIAEYKPYCESIKTNSCLYIYFFKRLLILSSLPSTYDKLFTAYWFPHYKFYIYFSHSRRAVYLKDILSQSFERTKRLFGEIT
jgi:hypothetical protein